MKINIILGRKADFLNFTYILQFELFLELLENCILGMKSQNVLPENKRKQ